MPEDNYPTRHSVATAIHPPVSLSLVGGPDGGSLLISIIPPQEPTEGERPPMDFVLTIDVSRSMGLDAPIPGQTESTGLTVLDIVKHAAKTIITTMKDGDRVAVVKFSRHAEVVVPLTEISAESKQMALDAVARLDTEARTNIWAGLEASMDILTQADPFTNTRGRATKRLSSIFLLTDGQPTVTPPRRHGSMLKLYLEQHSPANFIINTFGFGYDLDSQLLVDLAKIGGGLYSFIPDSGMVGTVFVHAIANTYAIFAEDCRVEVKFEDRNVAERLKVLGKHPWTTSSTAIQIPIGYIQYSQTRDLIISFDDSRRPFKPIKVTVKCRPWSSLAEVTVTKTITLTQKPSNTTADPRLTYHQYRLLFVSTVFDLFSDPDDAELSSQYVDDEIEYVETSFPEEAHEDFTLLASTIRNSFYEERESLPSSEAADALALAQDIEGEVLMAVGDEASWSRWGCHYLPSLAEFHLRQQCSNFKDPGLQVYGRNSPLFITCRDEIDMMFDNLPPPEPVALLSRSVVRISSSSSQAVRHTFSAAIPLAPSLPPVTSQPRRPHVVSVRSTSTTASAPSPQVSSPTQETSLSSPVTLLPHRGPRAAPSSPQVAPRAAPSSPRVAPRTAPSSTPRISPSSPRVAPRTAPSSIPRISPSSTPTAPLVSRITSSQRGPYSDSPRVALSPPRAPRLSPPPSTEVNPPTPTTPLSPRVTAYSQPIRSRAPFPTAPISTRAISLSGQVARSPQTTPLSSSTPQDTPISSRSPQTKRFPSMASYNSRANPCFGENCTIEVGQAPGRLAVRDIRKGTVVKTPCGPRRVFNIIRTTIQGGVAELCQIGGLVITPWHPIKLDGSDDWVFPAHVTQPKALRCGSVYSILIESDCDSNAHGVYVDGVLCVTLGHGIMDIEGDARSHAFLGNYTKIREVLKKYPFGENEDGVLEAIGVARDARSGLVNGFDWKPIRPKDFSLGLEGSRCDIQVN